MDTAIAILLMLVGVIFLVVDIRTLRRSYNATSFLWLLFGAVCIVVGATYVFGP